MYLGEKGGNNIAYRILYSPAENTGDWKNAVEKWNAIGASLTIHLFVIGSTGNLWSEGPKSKDENAGRRDEKVGEI